MKIKSKYEDKERGGRLEEEIFSNFAYHLIRHFRVYWSQ